MKYIALTGKYVNMCSGRLKSHDRSKILHHSGCRTLLFPIRMNAPFCVCVTFYVLFIFFFHITRYGLPDSNSPSWCGEYMVSNSPRSCECFEKRQWVIFSLFFMSQCKYELHCFICSICFTLDFQHLTVDASHFEYWTIAINVLYALDLKRICSSLHSEEL